MSQCAAPNVTQFNRVHQWHVGHAMGGSAHLRCKCTSQLGANGQIPRAGVVKFELCQLGKSNLDQFWPNTSSAE